MHSRAICRSSDGETDVVDCLSVLALLVFMHRHAPFNFIIGGLYMTSVCV